MNTHAEVLPEGEEPPPRGVRAMAWVRWVLIALLAVLAAWSMATFWFQKATPANATPETAAAARNFVCPMHPQIHQDHPGTCPICGMDLVEKKAEVVVERWTCPMHPQIHQDHAGACPICGMDLVREEAGNATRSESMPELATVTLPTDRVQRMGVVTVTAKQDSLGETLRTVGVLTPAEGRNAVVQTRFNGWIEELLVAQTGARVKKGDALARVYSPEVVQAVEEYRSAHARESEDPLLRSMRQASAQRLTLLGVDPSDVVPAATGRPSVTLRSPRDGHVIQKNALDGMYVQPGTALFEVADLGVVWLLVEVREDALERVTVGQKVKVTLSALPSTPLQGTLTYLYPAVDPATRTLKARVELQNPKLLLRPGMAATVDIQGAPLRGVVLPADAVIHTGRGTYAFVEKSPGTFEPRALTLGTQVGDRVLVRSGVEEGEAVVTGALFLLDSESRLRAGLLQNTGGGTAGGGHDPHAH